MGVFERLEPRLQHAIVARLGWKSLRPVQDQAGVALLDGHNAVVLAPTAGGKTEAAVFPALSWTLEAGASGVSVLYVAPIKALLNNQAERLGLYTEMVGLSRFVWHGDTASSARQRFVKQPAELLMTTPESLEVMLISGRAQRLFTQLRMVIVDEVHALAGTDRGAHLMSVLERIACLSSYDLQRVGLSATVGNPEAILGWLRGGSNRHGVVVDPPSPRAKRRVLVLHHTDPAEMVRDASALARGNKTLFFCQSRALTESVAEGLSRQGTHVFVHHSSVSKEERLEAEERFHRGTDACIVCTSTLELGIDVGDLDLVLQSEAPGTVGSFLQRMGRTGRRAGQVANTTFFCGGTETVLQAAALVELARERWVEDVELTDRCWPVLVHQVLAMALAGGGVSPDQAWAQLSQAPDFAGVHRAEFDRLLAWMHRDRGIDLLDGRILLGPKSERLFGRNNFMRLYAVFSSPVAYTVLTRGGRPIGTLEQQFVDQLVEDASCFLLGGRPWVPVRLDHDLRRVEVEAAKKGKQPTWAGYLPRFLGFDVCQRIRALLESDVPLPFLHETAREVLAEERERFCDTLVLGHRAIEYDEQEIRWWTFAGGRINNTLRYALRACHPEWKVVVDNFMVSVRGADAERDRFDEAMAKLNSVEFWEDDAMWKDIAADLPNYRLSKFQPLMPPWAVREMVAAYLLDIDGAWRWLGGSEGWVAPDLEQYAEHVQVDAGPAITGPRPLRPIRWIANDQELADVCGELARERVIGLDVETTLGDRALCLVQIATPRENVLIDALEVNDLAPLASILESPGIRKLVHYAPFERAVLANHEMRLTNVVDTCELSREVRGKKADGHSLKAACRRELGIELDKGQQTSDWRRRPLTDEQLHYAALDAEVLLALHVALAGAQPNDQDQLA